MHEFALLLILMNAEYPHGWTPQTEPAKAVLPSEARLSPKEYAEFVQAVKRIAKRATGRMVWDSVARMFVPELKPCPCAENDESN